MVKQKYTKEDVVKRIIEIAQENKFSFSSRNCYMIDCKKVYTAGVDEGYQVWLTAQSFDEFIIERQDEQLWDEFSVKPGCDFTFEEEGDA